LNWASARENCFDTNVLSGLKEVTVPKGEEYAADCLAVNGTVLMSKGYPRTKKLSDEEGLPVQELGMSEFKKGDGLTCLSIVW
jgi:dimethylargininase